MQSVFKTLFILSLFLAISSCKHSSTNLKPIEYVNPFIGTGGHGHTYPGAAVPFGMVQLSPDTRLEGWDGCGGYHYSDSIIYGFSHTHLSGTGIPDYADVLLMPTVGVLEFENGYKSGVDKGYASRFSHQEEKASPGYYEVLLQDYQIGVALTSSARAGFHRYTFPETDSANIIIDLEHRDQLLDVHLEVLNDSTIQGYRISKAWAEKQFVFFYAQFSKPFKASVKQKGKGLFENKSTKIALNFTTEEDESILVKMGISAVDLAGAKNNLQTEIPHWNFNKTLSEAQILWEKELGKIEVEGDNEDQKTIFYTALYHTFLNPNLFMDADKRYRALDKNIYTADGFVPYTVFSLWDTFRGAHPLYTLVQQEKTNQFIKTFLDHYKKGGLLPVWELSANETWCMIGYHAVPVIVDAYAKGIKDYDVNLALKAMLKSASQNHFGLDAYRSQGYIPADYEPESVSKVLEYAYDDWCIAQMAQSLNENEINSDYLQRGQYYKNIFDPTTGFMRARMNGTWFSPFEPTEVNYNYTEANSWQYSMFAPQDISGLIQLHGGADNFEKKLDELFQTESELSGREQADITGLIGQYAHGNEPSHHMAYLYNFVGKPWKTQQRVSQILNELYSNNPDGLSGNEDCGQMSAWYVLSAMGFYSVTPGLPYYTIGSPIFDKVTIHLENGKDFVIDAQNVSKENVYIQDAKLNAVEHKKSFINHSDIMDGGELVLKMGAEPKENWFTESPISSITNNLIVPVPYIDAAARIFTDSILVRLGNVDSRANIFYTLDGSKPTPQSIKYNNPLTLKETANIRAIAFVDDLNSFPIEAKFYKIDGRKSIKQETTYANQYAAGGDKALIDYQRGGNNFRTGSWQGYQGQDLVATVDLGETKSINSVKMGFLQDIKSWVWFPKSLEVLVSVDGKTFIFLGKDNNTLSDNTEGSFIQDLVVKGKAKARYVKVKAINYGGCPPWHLGAGGASWIFSDEIVVE